MWDGRRANKDSSCNPIVSITKQIIKIRPSVITIIIIIVINCDRFMRGYRSFAFVCLTNLLFDYTRPWGKITTKQFMNGRAPFFHHLLQTFR